MKKDWPGYVEEDRGYSSPCHIWQGHISPQDYGTWGIKGAHRIAYEAAKGPLAPGLEPDHLCRVRACINADHMEAVTRRVNARRGLAGEHNRKLTRDDVAAIRGSAEGTSVLAKRYGVSPTRISQLRRAA